MYKTINLYDGNWKPYVLDKMSHLKLIVEHTATHHSLYCGNVFNNLVVCGLQKNHTGPHVSFDRQYEPHTAWTTAFKIVYINDIATDVSIDEYQELVNTFYELQSTNELVVNNNEGQYGFNFVDVIPDACNKSQNGWSCTRKRGHEKNFHVAHYETEGEITVCAKWDY